MVEILLKLSREHPSDDRIFLSLGLGYRSVERFAQTFTLEGEVGASVRRVDVQSGEILWVGTSSQEALNIQIASEILAQRIMKALRKIWPKPITSSKNSAVQKNY